MENEDHGGKHDQLEEHSLPGTNQAGKGLSSCEKSDQENSPSGGGPQHKDQLEEHSLPGTTQAGKGLSSCEKNDQENRPVNGSTRVPSRCTSDVRRAAFSGRGRPSLEGFVLGRGGRCPARFTAVDIAGACPIRP